MFSHYGALDVTMSVMHAGSVLPHQMTCLVQQPFFSTPFQLVFLVGHNTVTHRPTPLAFLLPASLAMSAFQSYPCTAFPNDTGSCNARPKHDTPGSIRNLNASLHHICLTLQQFSVCVSKCHLHNSKNCALYDGQGGM